MSDSFTQALPLVTKLPQLTSLPEDAGGIGGSTGSTDNALLRADGAGGSTTQGSSVTLSDSANLSATNWQISSGAYSGTTYAAFTANGASKALILSPGLGSFIAAQVPDGTTTGGNLRGAFSTDFSMYRDDPSQVASGPGCVLFGFSNTASGNYCGVLGAYSYATGSVAAFAIGVDCTASGEYSIASGNGGLAPQYGQMAYAAGYFASPGDAQGSVLVARVSTTNATPTNLFLNGSSSRLLVRANSSGRARITITARRATAGAETMTWVREVAWQRGVAASTTTIDVQTIGTDRGYTGGAWGAGPAWAISITADTTNGAISIIGTGVVATNIRWVARIDWVEVTYA